MWVQPSGATLESEYAYILYDFPIDSANSYETFRFAVNQNDEIHITCSNADCSVQVIGLVQFDVNLGVGISSFSPTAPTNTVDGLIWVDSDATLTGGKHPAYVWDSNTSTWAEFVGGIDETADYTFTELPEGLYEFLILHANGCQQEISATVDNLDSPDIGFLITARLHLVRYSHFAL